MKLFKVLILLTLPVLATNAWSAVIEVLNDRSFESGVFSQPSQTSGFTAADVGNWAVGDPFSVVTAENGITPLHGNNMLKFGTTGGSSSDLYQIVDLTAFGAQIDSGTVTADLSIHYNAVAAGGNAGLRLLAYGSATLPTTFSGLTVLGGNFQGLSLDGDPSTW